MLDKKMQDALNAQIREELESSYIYLSMAAYFHAEGWEGMAAWMEKQVQEETSHAMKFFKHIVERDGRVKIPAIKEPKAEWASPLDAFKATFAHEQHITSKIYELVKLAQSLNDYAAQVMLNWFVSEQVEEEANVTKVLQRLERIGESGNGLIMLDHQLGQR